MKKRKFYSREDILNALDELEFSLVSFEPYPFKVIPIRVSFRQKDKKFSGLVVKYKGVKGFIPQQELQNPFHILDHCQKLANERIPIQVYLLRIDEKRNSFNLSQWQMPIFSMFLLKAR